MSTPQQFDVEGQSEREFGRIFEASLNEILIFDASTLKIAHANRGARHNLGYSLDEMCTLSPWDLSPDLTPVTFQELVSSLRKDAKQTVVFETSHRRKDGSFYDVEVHLQRSTCQGKPAYVAIILDTTSRKSTEQALRESELRSRAILDNAVEAIITIDDAGTCELFNRAAEKIFGYREAEVVGENVSMLMPAPYVDEHDQYIRSYLETGEKKIIGIGREIVGRRKDGTIFPIQLSVSEVQLGDRRIFTGIIQDISERKEAQARLVQSERLAAVGEAMTSLAHESRNLLQKIQMAVEMGRLDVEDHPELVRHLNSIEHASDGLQALLSEVRNYAAPVKLELEEASIPDLWREAWQLVKSQREGRQTQLIEEGKLDLDSCQVDRFRLVQVFRNLLENSLAACSDPVELRLSLSEAGNESGPGVRIRYRDNGPGLSKEQCQRVFEPFFTTKSKGTGLGMAIAQRIVEAHGGSIAVSAGEPRGAEFLIELPR